MKESVKSLMSTLDYMEQAGEQDTDQYHQLVALMRELSKQEKDKKREGRYEKV